MPYQRVQPVQVDRPLGRRSEPTAGHAGKIIKCVNILCMAPRMVYCSIINLLWSLMLKLSTTFRSVSYRPNLKNTKILTRESNWHKRKVKEAI